MGSRLAAASFAFSSASWLSVTTGAAGLLLTLVPFPSFILKLFECCDNQYQIAPLSFLNQKDASAESMVGQHRPTEVDSASGAPFFVGFDWAPVSDHGDLLEL